MTITKDLQAISKELTKLVKQTDKLAVALEKAEKPKAKSVKTKPKAKAVTKKAPVKGGRKTDTRSLQLEKEKGRANSSLPFSIHTIQISKLAILNKLLGKT